MIELFILGIVLFIAGIGATMLYDKVKADQASREEAIANLKAKIPQSSPGWRAATKKYTAVETSRLEGDAFEQYMKDKFAEEKRQAETAKLLNQGNTVKVEDLIKILEDMKKKL